MDLKIGPLALALCLLGLAALPLALAGPDAPPAPYCQWNHSVLRDQYVTYDGFFTETVGVVFLDGSPSCQVQVVCGGTLAYCLLPPLA